MACFDDDIVVIVLLFACKSLFFGTWYTIDFSIRLLYHVFTTYSVFFWTGTGVCVYTAVKVATRPRPEDSDLPSIENLEPVTPEIGAHINESHISITAELELELAKERERGDNLQRERDCLEAECRDLRSNLQLDVTDNGSQDQTVLKQRDNADRNRTTMAELEQELADERERADNLQRDKERLEEECRDLRCRLQTASEETLLKRQVNQEIETVPKRHINDNDPEAGSSPADTAESGAADPTVNIGYVNNVYFCDGNENGDPLVIAKLDWERTFYRDQAEVLQRQNNQIQETYDDLNTQLCQERARFESTLREQAEDYRRSLLKRPTAVEMELLSQQYLSESRRMRNESNEKIANLETRLRVEEERAGLSQAALRQLQEERRQQDENVMKFVLALESKVERLLKYLEENQLKEVADALQKDFNIRLLAIDSGLNVVMEASTQDWARIAEQKIQIQMEIQRHIERLLPEEMCREGLRWQELQECPRDVDIQLGQPLPAGIAALIHRNQTSASGSGDPVAVSESFVPKKAKPEFSIRTSTESDQYIPNISAVLDDPTSQRVFIADCINDKIKFASISAPDIVDELVLSEGVWAMAHLREKVMAVTGSGAITLLDITGRPELMQTVYTSRYYYGIATLDGDTLLVSCCREPVNTDDPRGEGERPASVDIIKADGQFVKTVIDSAALPELKDPYYLCIIGKEVLISDKGSNCLFRVDLETGQLLQRLDDPRVMAPCQVCTDGASSVYLACQEGQRVLMATQAGVGEVTELLTGLRHGEGAARCPCAVGVMGPYLLVSWDDRNRHNSVVKGYQLS